MSLTTAIYIFGFVFCDVFMQVAGQFCKEYGKICPVGQSCCETSCCFADTNRNGFRWSVWNMWYFWFVVIFIVISCFGGCGYWRRRQLMLHQQQSILQHQQAYNNYMHQTAFSVTPHSAVLVPPYATAGPPPPAAQPEGAFPAPPPYDEVAKPYYYSPHKDELPAYTAQPYHGDFSNMVPPAGAAMGASGNLTSGGMVPGLPPYSALVDTPAACHQPTADQPVSPPSAEAENQNAAAASAGAFATGVAPPVASTGTMTPPCDKLA